MANEVRPSTLAMVVLLLLHDEPLHPYGLRQRIRDWDKDRVVNVTQRNAIYQTMSRLARDGLIEVLETAKDDNRPERTVYRATKDGVRLAKAWLRDMLAVPADEFPQFPAALAFLGAITGKTALRALQERADALQERIATMNKEVEAGLAEFGGDVDPIHLVEIDYLRTMWQSELTWVRGLITHLSAG